MSPSEALAAEKQELARKLGRVAPVPFEIGPATLYQRGAFGYRGILVRSFNARTERYAQYESALRAEWVVKGKRKREAYMLTYDPGLVVLAGHEHPQTPSPMTPLERAAGGLLVQSSRRTCFDPGWETEFDAWLTEYLEQSGAQLVGDYRGFDTGANRRATEPVRVSP